MDEQIINITVSQDNVRHYYGGAFGTGEFPKVTPIFKLDEEASTFLLELGEDIGKSVSTNQPDVILDLNYFLSHFEPSGLLTLMNGLRMTGHSCMDIDYEKRSGENRDLLIRFFNAVDIKNQHTAKVVSSAALLCSEKVLVKFEAYSAQIKGK